MTPKIKQNLTQKVVNQPPHTKALLVLKQLFQFPIKTSSPKSELIQHEFLFIQQVKTHTMGH